MTDDPLILIEAWLDGDLAPAGQQQLEAWLREDPNHLQIFARETHLHRQLHDMLRGQANSPPAEEGEGKDALPPVPGQSPVLGFLQGMLNISGDTPGMTAFLWLVMAALTGMTLMAVLMLVLTIRGVHVTVEPQQQSRQQAAGSGQKGEGGRGKAEGGRPRVDGEKSLDGPPSPFPLPPSPLVLSANQALRFDAENNAVVRQAATPERFVRVLGPKLPPFPVSTGRGVEPDQPDPYWQIVAVSDEPDFKPQPALVVQPGWPFLEGSLEKAQWIMRESRSYPPGCRWTFRTHFDLKGFDPATARIEGQVSVDDYLVEVRLNGKPVSLSKDFHGPSLNGKWTPLAIDQGFVEGVNTLEMVVENGSVGRHMGLMVDWKGTAERTKKRQ